MRIEVICTGDELLTGLTADTNSPFFMERLVALGEQVSRARIVGDVAEDIREALLEASHRADAVLVSGGLGPTADDLTAQCAADAAGVPLVEDAAVLRHIQERFARRGIVFTPNNARQAQVPEGAEVVLNPVGSAPMFVLRLNRCTFFFVAGVPREYRHLVEHEVLPRLKRLIEAQPNRVYRSALLLRTVNLPESHLDAKVRPLFERHPQVRFGFRTQAPENHLKLLAEGSSQPDADAALARARMECLEVLGEHYFAENDTTFEAAVASLLRECGVTVAVAESCTGGWVSQLLTQEAGSSAWFQGGVVVYQDARKREWAGVEPEVLREQGAVSEVVARQLAEGIRERVGSTYGLGVTGFAGPSGGTAETPVGTVHLALATPTETRAERHLFLGERERVRHFATYAVLDLLRRELLRGGRR